MERINEVSELFRCVICLTAAKDPKMCPRCSKLCCGGCIERALAVQDSPVQRCPHCRQMVQHDDFVSCRWAEEASSRLRSLELNMSAKSDTPTTASNDEMCPDHGHPLAVFCSDCQKSICFHCALFTPMHKGHRVIDIAVVYAGHVEKITRHLENLHRQQSSLLTHMRGIERSVERLRRGRDLVADQIHDITSAALRDVDTQLESKLELLLENKNKLSSHARQLEAAVRAIENQLHAPRNRLIEGTPKLLELSVKASASESVLHATSFQVTDTFSNPLRPEFSMSGMRIPAFLTLASQPGHQPLLSDELVVDGLVWRLAVHPAGTGASHLTHLSVFIEMVDGPDDDDITYEWQIELEQRRGSSARAQDPVSRHHACNFLPGECWGFERFYPLHMLEREGFVDESDGSISIRFGIRCDSYKDAWKVSQWHNAILQQQLRRQEEVVRAATGSLAMSGQPLPASFQSHLARTSELDQPAELSVHSLDGSQFVSSELETAERRFAASPSHSGAKGSFEEDATPSRRAAAIEAHSFHSLSLPLPISPSQETSDHTRRSSLSATGAGLSNSLLVKRETTHLTAQSGSQSRPLQLHFSSPVDTATSSAEVNRSSANKHDATCDVADIDDALQLVDLASPEPAEPTQAMERAELSQSM